jgi:anti-sigma factor RsiW
MRCINPNEIQEGDLLDYVEGRAGPQVRAHVNRCPFCAAEAEGMARIDGLLTAALYRVPCPETEVLVQYQAGLLPAGAGRQIKRHVDQCPHCAGEVARLSALDAPERSLWQEMRRAVRSVVEAVSVRPPARLAAAVRGGVFHQRLYQADGLDVVLGSEPSRSTYQTWQLRGRVTRGGVADATLASCAVRLVQQDRIVAQEAVDDLGYFCLDQLAPGSYELWIELPDVDVVVLDVVVGSPEKSE